MTHYIPPDLLLPHGLQTAQLRLEPLMPDHVALDYEAVMESREQLRLWSGSTWPVDDFTLADNLKDLEHHWREHQARLAFTFTVLDPQRTLCLGCVYLRPLAELEPANPAELTGVAADETLVRFWIRTSRLRSELERHLLDVLIDWFAAEWPFSRVLFETRAVNHSQRLLFEIVPLHQVMALQMPQRGGLHLFYQP